MKAKNSLILINFTFFMKDGRKYVGNKGIISFVVMQSASMFVTSETGN